MQLKPESLVMGLRALRGQVAQVVEQRTENPCVGGSNPSLTTPKQSRILFVKWAQIS